MPQTTNSVPMSCALVEISTASDCSGWVNVGGSTNSISVPPQTKMHASEHTFVGDYPLIEVGKYEELEITFRSVFTNVPTETYRTVRDQWLAGACDGKLCVRWIPSGAVGGDGMQTGYVPIKSFQWPNVDAGAAGPIMITWSIIVGEIDPFVYVS